MDRLMDSLAGLPPFAAFALCAAVVGIAGYRLSQAADDLAEAHGWGRGWVGLALLATVTSLPELASGVSAVAWVGAVDLAVGNALGACLVNLLFLVVVEALQRQPALYRLASPSHRLSAGFGALMLLAVLLSLLAGAVGWVGPTLLHIEWVSPLLLVLYLLALRSVFRHEQRSSQARTPQGPARAAWRRFLLCALLVLAAGGALPQAAAALATPLGLSHGQVGTGLMALVTTLPEMAVTLGALRLGQPDLAIGNLLGSNLFNAAILAIDDLAYRQGPLLAHASPGHAASAATALLMTGIVLTGLWLRPQAGLLRGLSWVGVGLLAAYALNATLWLV